jgi:hypothetical protein
MVLGFQSKTILNFPDPKRRRSLEAWPSHANLFVQLLIGIKRGCHSCDTIWLLTMEEL